MILLVFSKTVKYIQCHFQMRNSNCSAAEVTEENFKIWCCVFTFLLSAEFFLLPMADNQTFSVVVSKRRMSREFCSLFTGS